MDWLSRDEICNQTRAVSSMSHGTKSQPMYHGTARSVILSEPEVNRKNKQMLLVYSRDDILFTGCHGMTPFSRDDDRFHGMATHGTWVTGWNQWLTGPESLRQRVTGSMSTMYPNKTSENHGMTCHHRTQWDRNPQSITGWSVKVWLTGWKIQDTWDKKTQCETNARPLVDRLFTQGNKG